MAWEGGGAAAVARRARPRRAAGARAAGRCVTAGVTRPVALAPVPIVRRGGARRCHLRGLHGVPRAVTAAALTGGRRQPKMRARRSFTASAPRPARTGGAAGAQKAAYTRPSAAPNLPPRAQSGRRRRATACPHSVEGLGDVYVILHRRLACRQVGCSGEVAIVLAAVTFGGKKIHESFLRFGTHKAVHSSVIAVLGDMGINVDAFRN